MRHLCINLAASVASPNLTQSQMSGYLVVHGSEYKAELIRNDCACNKR